MKSELVKERYGKLALEMNVDESASCCGPTCCSDDNENTKSTTERPDLSLGCDLRLIEQAAPKTGEKVIDLGSGSGYDCRRMVKLVGETGKIIGIDFEEEMINLARKKSIDHPNISFIHADINDIPIKDNFIDLIVSNCVFNLVEDKSSTFAEAYRLLKPGGRIVISDKITMDTDVEITGEDFCSCIGGATSIDEYLEIMKNVGFVRIKAIPEYENTYQGELGPIAYQSVLFQAFKD